MHIDPSKLSRVTLVSEDPAYPGRVYEQYGLDVELSVQDDGRTLKIFVKPNPAKEKPIFARYLVDKFIYSE